MKFNLYNKLNSALLYFTYLPRHTVSIDNWVTMNSSGYHLNLSMRSQFRQRKVRKGQPQGRIVLWPLLITVNRANDSTVNQWKVSALYFGTCNSLIACSQSECEPHTGRTTDTITEAMNVLQSWNIAKVASIMFSPIKFRRMVYSYTLNGLMFATNESQNPSNTSLRIQIKCLNC